MKPLVLLRRTFGEFLRGKPPALRAPVVASLGNFDGVHRGHQQLLAALRHERDARGGATVLLLSFYPHPVQVLRGGEPVRILTPMRQKVELLAAEGVEVFALLHFTRECAEVSAYDFVHKFLIDCLGVRALVIGPDARVGKEREGTPEFMAQAFAQRGGSVSVLPFYGSDRGGKISSGTIRALVERGEAAAAAELLGRHYILDGLVAHGDRRGSTIGVPTANLAPSQQVLPANGVYATYAELGGKKYPAVTNVGHRPTFGGVRVIVETHLLDYAGEDFYGARLKVHVVSRLRGEQRFSGVQALVAQIHADMESARCVLKSGALP